MMKHYGDPCLFCGIPHDDVQPGPCRGNPDDAVVALIARLREAEAERDEARMTTAALSAKYQAIVGPIVAERDRLREALQFIGDDGTYWPRVSGDNAKLIARAALKEPGHE